MLDEFIYRYRFLIGGTLIVLIVLGSSILFWQNNKIKTKNEENLRIFELQKQNDELRAQLIKNPEISGVDSEDQGDKININLADEDQLDELPGIGPSKAADIISYREENGDFQSIEELKDVSGIGEKTFENLKDLITTGEN